MRRARPSCPLLVRLPDGRLQCHGPDALSCCCAPHNEMEAALKEGRPPGEEQLVDDSKIPTMLYPRRWAMLFLAMLYSGMVWSQWAEYVIISNIIAKYYRVSSIAVDCTAMTPMVFYGILIFPLTYLCQRYGLRWTTIMGSVLCCLGSWIKILSVPPDRFIVALLGHSVVGISMVMSVVIPGQVAASWFGANELSKATSLVILGSQLGTAIGYYLPPVLVKNHEDHDKIGTDLKFMLWAMATASTVNLVLVGLFFQEDPFISPSETRALQKTNQSESKEGFFRPLKRLFTNKSFLILCNSYGLNVGVQNGLGTLFNPLYLAHFKDGEEDAGRLGSLVTLIGMVGSILFGIILDKTLKFKETAVIVYFMTLSCQILFSISLFTEMKWLVYISTVFVGFFMSGYMTLGYELAAEYTYPESETLAAGLLNITNNIYGIFLVIILEVVLEKFGDMYVHAIISLILMAGFVMTAVTKDEQRRQNARRAAAQYQDMPRRKIREECKHGDP